MIQRIVEDDDGNTALEFDDDGIEYLIDGLNDLLLDDVGSVYTTPSFWYDYRPWWKFWKPKKTMISGELRLRKVA